MQRTTRARRERETKNIKNGNETGKNEDDGLEERRTGARPSSIRTKTYDTERRAM